MITLKQQIIYLFILATPIASIAWSVTHEELFKELQEHCKKQCKTGRNIIRCKFFYMLTCEYCFSHYITVLFLMISKFHMLFNDWRGYLIAGFALVWIANIYMNIFALLRINLKKDRVEANIKEEELKEKS